MQLRGATASHVGNVRDSNQDRVHFGGYTGVVADGMGGHQGGEMAASIAISNFVDEIDPIAPGGLVDLVEEANRAVFEKAADPDLRGMGTTLVALTLRPNEENICIVNVGDSRAYHYRQEQMRQITLDHSLVEDLVRQKRLTPEEALTHPQRNILTRALGIASQVEVDRFLEPAEVGDRFLLCSDGLFNEVTEPDIAQILRDHPEPDDAAHRLVEAALAAAGRDNVTVAVIDVVEDGHGANLSSEAAETLLVPRTPSAEPTEPVEAIKPEVMAAAGQAAVGLDVVERADDHDLAYDDAGGDEFADAAGALDEHTADLADEPALAFGTTDAEDSPAALGAEAGRRPRWGRRLLATVVVLGALAAGAYVALDRLAWSQWFVAGTDDGQQVALFRGRPTWIDWLLDPEVEQMIEVPVDDLMPDQQVEVRGEPTFDDRAAGEAFLDNLQPDPELIDPVLEDVEVTDESTTTEAPATTTSAPSTEATAEPPAPDDESNNNQGNAADEGAAADERQATPASVGDGAKGDDEPAASTPTVTSAG